MALEAIPFQLGARVFFLFQIHQAPLKTSPRVGRVCRSQPLSGWGGRWCDRGEPQPPTGSRLGSGLWSSGAASSARSSAPRLWPCPKALQEAAAAAARQTAAAAAETRRAAKSARSEKARAGTRPEMRAAQRREAARRRKPKRRRATQQRRARRRPLPRLRASRSFRRCSEAPGFRQT